MEELKQEWIKICSKYSRDIPFIYHTFDEIIKKYNEENRHYHNLQHIFHFFKHTQKIKDKLNDYDSFFFAIIFHDVIYSTSVSTNEYDSAEYAKKILTSMNFPFIEKVYNLILLTEKHTIHKLEDFDSQAFLDLDLSILGGSWENYLEYAQRIQKEWKNVPTFMYKIGRKKVLQKFLDQKNIYRSAYFQDLYEKQAKINLKKELNSL